MRAGTVNAAAFSSESGAHTYISSEYIVTNLNEALVVKIFTVKKFNSSRFGNPMNGERCAQTGLAACLMWKIYQHHLLESGTGLPLWLQEGRKSLSG